ncbi:MAG: glycosyltransferase family 2 protein [Thermoleophilia bacterium]
MSGNNVSIAMCTFNGDRYLREQLESFKSRTRLPKELVVCDDGSSDDSVQIVQAFADRAGFPVRIFENRQTLGSTKNFEKAIGLCEGDIIFLADQDDVWLPNKLFRVMEEFSQSQDLAGVLTDAIVADQGLEPLGFTFWQATRFKSIQRERAMKGRLGTLLRYNTSMVGATFAFRAAYRDLVLPIPDHWTHDAWIILIISALARVETLPEPLNIWRQHEGQQVGSWEKKSFSEQKEIAKHKDIHIAAGLAAGQYEAAAERLAAMVLKSPTEGKTLAQLSGRLEEKALHLRNRADLPRARALRLAPVTREICSRRYHRYSSGLRSSAKDLFFRA